MIEYQIVVRSVRVTSDGADTVDYVLAKWGVPDDMEFEQATSGLAEGFRIIAGIIDQKNESEL